MITWPRIDIILAAMPCAMVIIYANSSLLKNNINKAGRNKCASFCSTSKNKPLWVSEPRLKLDGSHEDEFKFRYVLSFQRAL